MTRNMASISPSDSASGTSKKKNRPGKNARAAARAVSSAPTSEASFFASQGMDLPIPQPGRFPVVFRAGVGEPSRDVDMAYDPQMVSDIIEPLTLRYVYNPKYAEFSSHSGYDDEDFARDLQRKVLLGLAQQTVFAHTNMGMPLGDFSPMTSTEVSIPTGIAQVISQFGEHQDPTLGTRFFLKDYASTVFALVRAARDTRADEDRIQCVKRLWLPTKRDDPMTRFIIASRLGEKVREFTGVDLNLSTLASKIFHEEWDVFNELKPFFGANPDRFDFLFVSRLDEGQFTTAFTTVVATGVRAELNLPWDNPGAGHLAWEMVPKTTFPELANNLARKRATFAKFFSLSSTLGRRAGATGSMAQLSRVSSVVGVTVVAVHSALGAPELSLLVCFPPSALFSVRYNYNVLDTTPIPVNVRATEFLQLDWVR